MNNSDKLKLIEKIANNWKKGNVDNIGIILSTFNFDKSC